MMVTQLAVFVSLYSCNNNNNDDDDNNNNNNNNNIALKMEEYQSKYLVRILCIKYIINTDVLLLVIYIF